MHNYYCGNQVKPTFTVTTLCLYINLCSHMIAFDGFTIEISKDAVNVLLMNSYENKINIVKTSTKNSHDDKSTKLT